MITCLGWDRSDSFDEMLRGRVGARPLASIDRRAMRIAHGYELLAGAGERPSRAGALLQRCVASVLRDGDVHPERGRVASIVGTGLREFGALERWWCDATALGPAQLHFGGDVPGSTPVLTLANACSASSFALGIAADLISMGEFNAVVVGGADLIAASMFGLLDRVTAEPPEEVRPFDAARRGVLLGEGAAAVLVEPDAAARSRGVVPLARVLGVGMSCDAFHETAPSEDGIVAAIADAHARAGVRPADVRAIFAHGTGTALNDPTEASGLRRAFGPAIRDIPITATKSLIGHTSGASGLIAVVTALASMEQGVLPPTTGLSAPISEAADLDIVTAPRHGTFDVVQVNAFGFGGLNAVVVLGRP